jgi:hypothetical protein
VKYNSFCAFFYPVVLDIKMDFVRTLPTFASDSLMRANVCDKCIDMYGVSLVSECSSFYSDIVSLEAGALLMCFYLFFV